MGFSVESKRKHLHFATVVATFVAASDYQDTWRMSWFLNFCRSCISVARYSWGLGGACLMLRFSRIPERSIVTEEGKICCAK